MNKGTSFALWRFLSITFGVLIAVSIIYIIQHEVEKARLRTADAAQISVNVEPVSGKTPDIYYLMFDEFAGFTSMREYFNNPKAGEFKAYLQDEGFHVFEESRSSDIWSIHQIATRLNYFDYKYVKRHEEKWLYSIANNKAAAFVESKGYTTVFFEEFSWFFPTMPEIRADHVYDIRAFENFALKTLYDDFGMLVVDATMLFPLNHNKEHIKAKYQPLHDFIDYSIERIPNLEEIASPKFVFLHILMPHWPYLVDAAGNPVHPDFYQDWDYYEEYYEYSITVVQNMVDELLANADPENPPVIILQSDHGARALEYKSTLTDYPEEFQSDILFAVFTPGYDTSQLPQDLDPINTLPIVFNHYLGADIPLK